MDMTISDIIFFNRGKRNHFSGIAWSIYNFPAIIYGIQDP